MERTGIIARFCNRLDTEWKRKAFCGRHFYLTKEIYYYMRTHVQNEAGVVRSNTARLLSAISVNTDFEGLQPEIIDNEETPCVLVFAILILLNHGHLVLHFRMEGITDHNFADNDVSNKAYLIQELEDAGVEDHETLLNDFDRVKWQFCTRPFRLHMVERFLGGQWILPFTRREQITEGGTALVWEAFIREEMVDDAFQKAAAKSRLIKNGLAYYHVAIKSYDEEWRDSFNDELKAFRGVRGLEGFVVQYLGHYSHDEKLPDGSMHRTLNIILEYGELDLTEYIANGQQYPPVMQREIIQFWRLMLNVAEAIDRIHKLLYESGDGETKLYNGFHADIKPENILYVHGEFKLADFGFTRFIMAKPGAEAATDIYGGTKAFGAPEQYRSSLGRQQTKTPVTQAIDIWSFGCVLSVIATWVTLGFQGVAQFQALRTAALAKLNEETPLARIDTLGCFHDGHQILEKVTQWHKYLRLSLRRNDTVTERILDLIDGGLLKKLPSERLESGQMLQKLQDIVDEAQTKWMRSDIDQGLLKELLWQNLQAPATTLQAERQAETAKAEAAQQPQEEDGNMQQDLKSVVRALKAGLIVPQGDQGKSVRIGKSERVSVRIGRVAGRKEALEFETDTPSIQICEEPEEISAHPSPSNLGTSFNPPPPVISRPDAEKSVRYTPKHDHKGNSKIDTGNFAAAPRGGFQNPSPSQKSGWPPPPSSLSPYSTPPYTNVRPHPHSPVNQHGSPSWPLQVPPQSNTSQHQDSHPPLPNLLHIIDETDQQHHKYRDPQSLLGSPGQRTPQRQTSRDSFGAQSSGGAPVENRQETGEILATTLTRDFSRSPYQWDYLGLPIWEEHQAQEKRHKGFFKLISKDKKLSQFIDKRDIVFLVDNGTSMSHHWEWAKFVLHTLAMKLGKIDKDGMELYFTFGQLKLRSNDPAKFKNVMEKAQPRLPGMITELPFALSTIFDEYLQNPSKQMTVVIFTDGVWDGSSVALEKLVVDFVNALKGKIGNMKHRWFTIQFISFGNDPDGLERLRALDDDMVKTYGISDIIDTKPWYGDVDYMILGSIRDASEEQPKPVERRRTSQGPPPATQTGSFQGRLSWSSVLSDGRSLPGSAPVENQQETGKLLATIPTGDSSVFSTTSTATTVDNDSLTLFVSRLLNFQDLTFLWPQLVDQYASPKASQRAVERLLRRYAQDLQRLAHKQIPPTTGREAGYHAFNSSVARFVRRSRDNVAHRIVDAHYVESRSTRGDQAETWSYPSKLIEDDSDSDVEDVDDVNMTAAEAFLFGTDPILQLQASIKALVRQSRKRVSLINTFQSGLGNLYQRMLAPPPRNGSKRIQWACTCGKQIYDDFVELRPGALETLEKQLRQYGRDSIEVVPLDDDFGTGVQTTARKAVSAIQSAATSFLKLGSSSLPRFHQDSAAVEAMRELGSCRTSPPGHQSAHDYLLLCVPFMRVGTKLHQPEICRINSDKEFIELLRLSYAAQRPRSVWKSLRKVRSINFIKFETFQSGLVDIKGCPSLPADNAARREYHFSPVPVDVIPPIGPNHLTHLFEHPEHAEVTPVLWNRVPKKLKAQLRACPIIGSSVGWGLQIAEGTGWEAVLVHGCVGFALCLLVSVVWAGVKDDVQGGFAIGAFLVTFLGFVGSTAHYIISEG